ncbi:predicted protein [Methanosarcina acetivorans C2A]|uniref:Uncharacterized protein n=2 Tax=Methanosarcina acetivorans TaxID=2214 RepID=Q8TP75_METAC|nr:predicted protein [Methanosarcina acetivorans C2A]
MMEIRILEPNITVHDVPFEKIVCDNRDGNKLFIEFDDENEIRYKIEFVTYIALKITIDDCFDGSFLFDISNHGMMYEAINSDWFSQLKSEYNDQHPHGKLIDGAHHYIIGLGDFYVEIIARGYKLRKLSEEKNE